MVFTKSESLAAVGSEELLHPASAPSSIRASIELFGPGMGARVDLRDDRVNRIEPRGTIWHRGSIRLRCRADIASGAAISDSVAAREGIELALCRASMSLQSNVLQLHY
jgi:hypothetical protein